MKTVKSENGYCFVTTEEGKDVFAHRTSADDGVFEDLRPGDVVDVEVEIGPKGLRASRLVLA